MFCSNCGCLNEDDARFCGICGAKLAFQPQVAPQAELYQSVQRAQIWPVYPYCQAPQPTKLPGKGLGIAGLVLSLVALALGTAWVLSAILAILGIVFSAISLSMAKKAEKSNGLAVGGLICGIVAIAIAAVFVILTIEMFSAIPDPGLDYSVYM